jgi:hypothetical protein
MAKYPDVSAKFTVGDNVYVIIVSVELALKRAGYREAATEFREAAFASETYDDVVDLARETVVKV